MEKLKDFKNMIVDEFEGKYQKMMFVKNLMEDLDRLADKHGKTDIFHITGNEIIDYYEDDEALTLEEFIKSLDLEKINDKSIVSLLGYLLQQIQEQPDKQPYQLIEQLFEEL